MNARSDATIKAPTAEYCLASFISKMFRKRPTRFEKNRTGANEYHIIYKHLLHQSKISSVPRMIFINSTSFLRANQRYTIDSKYYLRF